MRIKVSDRIDETIAQMDDRTKCIFVGFLCKYIENNIEEYTQKKTTKKPALFEKPRETSPDRQLKFKLIEKYNELL